MQTVITDNVRIIGGYLPNVLGALLILIVGWIVAWIISAVVRGVLRRTDIDDRIARSMGSDGVAVANAAGTIVFWLIMLFVLVAFLQTLSLAGVSGPLNQLLTEVLAFLPRLFSAALLLLLAWILATVLKRLVTGVLERVGIDRRLGSMMEGESTRVEGDERAPVAGAAVDSVGETAPAERRMERRVPGRISLAQTLGEVVYWLVFLLFLPAILGTLALEGILAPVQVMLNRLLGFLPNVVAAALILLVGWFVARIVQRIVAGLLAAVGVDRLGERVGLSRALGQQRLSEILGLLVYVLILIPVLISALDALGIEAVSRPATNMLNTILAAIPNIFAAAVVLLIAYVVGRVVSVLVANLLAGLGFNTIPARLGLARGTATVGERTPSEIVGALILVGIMLFASIEAARLLGFAALAQLLADFTVLAGQIILGLIIFALGLYLANLAAELVRDSGVANADLLALAARVAIVVLAGAMALRQMGLANEIVNLAFGLLLGAIAVAAAIAFGFGGRDIAGRELEGWVRDMKARRTTTRVTRPGPAVSPAAPPPPSAPAPGSSI
jgi:hypothetical protein